MQLPSCSVGRSVSWLVPLLGPMKWNNFQKIKQYDDFLNNIHFCKDSLWTCLSLRHLAGWLVGLSFIISWKGGLHFNATFLKTSTDWFVCHAPLLPTVRYFVSVDNCVYRSTGPLVPLHVCLQGHRDDDSDENPQGHECVQARYIHTTMFSLQRPWPSHEQAKKLKDRVREAVSCSVAYFMSMF